MLEIINNVISSVSIRNISFTIYGPYLGYLYVLNEVNTYDLLRIFVIFSLHFIPGIIMRKIYSADKNDKINGMGSVASHKYSHYIGHGEYLFNDLCELKLYNLFNSLILLFCLLLVFRCLHIRIMF